MNLAEARAAGSAKGMAVTAVTAIRRGLFAGQDLVVDAGGVLLIERAGYHVEARRNAGRRHRGKRQRDIAGRLWVLPLRCVDITVQHFLRGVERVAPAHDRDLARLDADLVEDALDRAGDKVAEANHGLHLALVGG